MIDPFQIQIQIYDVNNRNYRSIPVFVDTGASISLIPPQRLLDLGYNLTNATQRYVTTASELVKVLSVTVTKITAIKQSVENIEVTCFEPDADIPEELVSTGLLGMNFLSQFDNLNISFSRGTISLT